jgi:hypothetical protein
MKKLIRVLSMIIVSILLFWIGVITMGHQSSSAFDLGLFLCGAGLFHWVWWPESD